MTYDGIANTPEPHAVMWKLKSQPANAAGAQPPATYTDATATNVIAATQEEIKKYQAQAKHDIAEALSKVPGGFSLRFSGGLAFIPSLSPLIARTHHRSDFRSWMHCQ